MLQLAGAPPFPSAVLTSARVGAFAPSAFAPPAFAPSGFAPSAFGRSFDGAPPSADTNAENKQVMCIMPPTIAKRR